MITRRGMLAGAAGLAAAPGAAMAQEMRSLRMMAADKGLLFGCATATFHYRQPDVVSALQRDAAILVPEYEMKREEVETERGRPDFRALDGIFTFARANGMAVRGHPLVWYYANPPWLEAALAERRDEKLLTGYIGAMMRHCRGRMHSVDVVNEAILEDGSAMRPSLWQKAFGTRHIDMAFHACRDADPSPLRVYNDFGCEQGAAHNDHFRAATLRLLDGLIARGAPVQALGLQAHLTPFGNRVDQRKLRIFADEIRQRGLALLVTEMTVTERDGPSDQTRRGRAVADEARRFLDVVLDQPNLRAVLTWGITDRHLAPPYSAAGAPQEHKLIYDAAMRRKPLWHALAASFAARRVFY